MIIKLHSLSLNYIIAVDVGRILVIRKARTGVMKTGLLLSRRNFYALQIYMHNYVLLKTTKVLTHMLSALVFIHLFVRVGK